MASFYGCNVFYKNNAVQRGNGDDFQDDADNNMSGGRTDAAESLLVIILACEDCVRNNHLSISSTTGTARRPCVVLVSAS